MRIPIGSFPDERWATEIRDLLKQSHIDATIDVRGPRAYQVLVPKKQADEAGRTLFSLGYFTCSSSRPPSMGGVKDWRPRSASIDAEIESIVNKWIQVLANTEAALRWSGVDVQTAKVVEDRGYEDPVVYAEFGGIVFRNRVPLYEAYRVLYVRHHSGPPGYDLIDELGPITDPEYVDRNTVKMRSLDTANELLGAGNKANTEARIEAVIESIFGRKTDMEVPVSGEVAVYAKEIEQ